MPVYNVKIVVTQTYNQTIQAPDEDTAENLVEEMIDKDDIYPENEDRETHVNEADRGEYDED